MSAASTNVGTQVRIARVDLSVYTLEAVLKSAYRFTGRGYLHLQKSENSIVEVCIRPKSKVENPDDLLGEFMNDLLDQRLRTIVLDETRTTRDLIMAHALSRTGFIRPDLETADPR